MTYARFAYPAQNIRGTLVWEGETLTVDARAVLGGSLATARGTIERPGPDARVRLEFASSAFPIDTTLRQALEPDLRALLDTFHPSGSLRGVANLQRDPPRVAGGPEDVQIHAEVDLNPGSSIRWDGMPYLVRDLTGHLSIRPDRWVFTGMKGTNGTASGAAVIHADGEVVIDGHTPRDLKLTLRAEKLPFDQQLRDALPPEWQATWATLNPSGTFRIEAEIAADGIKEPHYHLRVTPEPEDSRVKLVLTPVMSGKGPQRMITLPPMENIAGVFTFDDGTVTMANVSFLFREAPVKFTSGTVVLRQTGEFQLAVRDLLVTKLRLDAELRKIMPPMMSEFAQRLDDGRSFWVRGNLGIGWSGRPGEPARCQWDHTTVVFNGNTIQTGLPLEEIQGQFENIQGGSDGRSLELRGLLNLDSIRVMGQQVTRLKAPVVVLPSAARLEALEAQVLGGVLKGQLAVTLDATPRYSASLELRNADLKAYTRSLPGKQDLAGRVSARLDLSGEGNSLRTVTGNGWARINDGDIGQLPVPLRWVKVPNFRPPTRTAFDAAEVGVLIQNGEAILDPIKLTGDAFSLNGSGTAKLQGERELDLRFSPAYGRDERNVPILSTAMREASGRMFDLRVTGPLANPTIRPEPLPDVLTRASQAMRRLAPERTKVQE
jgi:hypothetical protein